MHGAVLDAVAGMGVVDAGPGEPRPFRFRRVIGLERSVPALAPVVRRLGEVRILVDPADDPVGELAALLLDPIAHLGIVDRGPGPRLPHGLGRLIAVEWADALLRPADGRLEARIGIFAADHPVARHVVSLSRGIIVDAGTRTRERKPRR